MKTAFAYWDDRIAPVFDTARQINIVEAESGNIISESQETIPEELPVRKALRLAELGINCLVCGAISRQLSRLVTAYGIQVVPFVAGDLREVITAWLDGSLGREGFAMPGCFGPVRRRFRGIPGDIRGVNEMSPKGRGRGRGARVSKITKEKK